MASLKRRLPEKSGKVETTEGIQENEKRELEHMGHHYSKEDKPDAGTWLCY